MSHRVDPLDREFIPDELYHRDGHIQELRRALDNIPDQRRDDLVAIYGPSGSGKTTIAKYVTTRYDEEYGDLAVVYVDCAAASTSTSILHEVLSQLHRLPTRLQGVSNRYDYIAELREIEQPVLVVLDELDFLDDHSIIHTLFGTRGVWGVLIGVYENALLSNMHQGIRNRLQTARTIRLDRYSTRQLAEILWGRIELVMPPSRCTDEAVLTMADAASGDAHKALALLRGAIETFRSSDSRKITAELVQGIQSGVEDRLIDRYVQRLPTHPRLLYDIIESAGSINAGQLKREYVSRAVEPKSDRMRRKYLGALERYSLIKTTGSTRDRRYHITGRELL